MLCLCPFAMEICPITPHLNLQACDWHQCLWSHSAGWGCMAPGQMHAHAPERPTPTSHFAISHVGCAPTCSTQGGSTGAAAAQLCTKYMHNMHACSESSCTCLGMWGFLCSPSPCRQAPVDCKCTRSGRADATTLSVNGRMH